MDEIITGDCETMIAGATCTDCSLGMYMAFSKTPVFSRKPSVTACVETHTLAIISPTHPRTRARTHTGTHTMTVRLGGRAVS